MRFGRFQLRKRSGKQAGYILLVMLLAAAMLVIALLATAPRIAQQIKRDREEEMIHRGAQYARAIKRYYRKFGRYPATIDQLESTNNLRFLRKRYKDPVSPKGDWRLVRFGEVQFGRANAIPGAPTQGQSGFGQSSIGNTSFGQGTTGNSGFGMSTNTNSSLGQGDQSPAAAGSATTGSSGSQSSFGSQSAFGAGATTGKTGQVFGGGAIIGVASTSEAESLKEFDSKNHYNDWKFVYDPAIDRGGLINGPYNPKLAGFTTVAPGAQQPGQMSNPGGLSNTFQNQPGSYAPPSTPMEAPK